MASVPSSSSPPQRTTPSASDSGDSPALSPPPPPPPPPPPVNQVEDATNNGVFHVDQKNSDFADALDDLDSTQYIERFRQYEADYTRRLMAKYFSGKTLYGANIFDEQMTIKDEIIKSSRLPCFRSYANPVVGFEDQCSNGSTPQPVETQASIANGKHMVKKNN